MPSVKARLVIGLHELQVLRKVKWSSVRWTVLAVQWLRRWLNMLRNSFNMTDVLQLENLLLNSKYPWEVWTTLLVPSHIQTCVLLGFHEAKPTIKKLWRKKSLQICSPVMRLMVQALGHRLSLGLKLGSINPLNTELNPICCLLALLGAHDFLHVSRIRVKSLTLRRLMSYIYIYMEHPFLMFLDHT